MSIRGRSRLSVTAEQVQIVRHDRCGIRSYSRPGEDASLAESPGKRGSGHFGPPLEVGSVAPNRVQHRRKLSGDGDLGLLQSSPLHDSEVPPPEQAGPHDPCQQYVGRFDQVAAGQIVASLGDAAQSIAFTGLVGPRPQPQVSANIG